MVDTVNAKLLKVVLSVQVIPSGEVYTLLSIPSATIKVPSSKTSKVWYSLTQVQADIVVHVVPPFVEYFAIGLVVSAATTITPFLLTFIHIQG